MKKKYDSADEYYIYIFNRMIAIAPLVAIASLLVFTISRYFGLFQTSASIYVIIFDLFCLSYGVVTMIMKKIDIERDGAVNYKILSYFESIMVVILFVQWNMITYTFPTRDLWGCAPMFILVASCMFHSKTVLYSIVAVGGSMILSWSVRDDLLPVKDENFAENMVMRVAILIITFALIYILCRFAERFTRLAKENYKLMSKQNEDLENSGKDLIDFTAEVIEGRDHTSGTHVKRLKAYTGILAKQLAQDYPKYNLDDEKIEQITFACVLHDVGKIAIPDRILQKPGKLTDEEFEEMKKHTILGAQIVDKLPESIESDYKRCCREICQFHHEKVDGKGYPLGLKGDEIPIAAQIVSVVDCYDALTNERPYKNAFPHEMAINMILNGECGAFSDEIKSCLVKCKDQLLNI